MKNDRAATKRWMNLGIPRFGEHSDDHKAMIDVDPVHPTNMKLSIEQILEYNYNPRRAVNEKVAEIENLIRQRGFEGTLDITRRPGEKFYMPVRGGNTTLSCIKKVFDETQNPDLEIINCLFHPWVSELETRVNHLIENDVRGNLIWVDRSLAVMEAWKDLEQDADTTEKISQSKLADILKSKGYTIDQTTISRMQYTAETVYLQMPIALDAGLGVKQIVRIRKLEKAFQEYLRHTGIDEENALTVALEWFHALLSVHDKSEWNIAPIVDAVVEESANLTNTSQKIARLELEALIAGGKKGLEALGTNLEAAKSKLSHIPVLTEVQSAQSDVNQPLYESHVQRDDTQEISVAEDVVEISKTTETVPESRELAMEVENAKTVHGQKKLHQDNQSSESEAVNTVDIIDTVKKQMATSAHLLAQSVDLEDCVIDVEAENAVCGYLMDLPPEPLTNELPEQRKAVLWWLLCELCGQLQCEALRDILPNDTRLYQLIESLSGCNDKSALQAICAEYVSIPTVDTLSRDLLLMIDDESLSLLVNIIHGARRCSGIEQV